MSMDREQESFVSRRSILSAASTALAGATLTAVSLPALAQTNPDAELLRLDREHDVAYARALALDVRTDNLTQDEADKICDASAHLEFAIQDIPAQTWAGVAVKARIATEYVERCCREGALDDILPSLIDDILRLANVTPKQPGYSRLKEA
jgi:hypothetical protein